MKLVSIIVPIYNVEPYLEHCVASIQAQTYTNLDIILVDDESPDGCGGLCDTYAKTDQRIRVIHKKNGGLGDARNVGTNAAKGTYILYVDSDDSVHPQLVERTMRQAEESAAEMVLFDYVSVDENGIAMDVYSMNLPKGKVLSLKEEPKLLNIAPSAVNKLFSMTFLKRCNNPFPVGKYYEDLGTIPKLLAQAERVVYLEAEPLYYYLIRSDSIMHTHNFEKNFTDRRDMLTEVICFFKQQNIYQAYQKELEFLTLDNGYFLPCKEIVLMDPKNPVLHKFRRFIEDIFPEFADNPYVKQFTKKNKILFWLLRKRMYRTMLFLSYMRRLSDVVVSK